MTLHAHIPGGPGEPGEPRWPAGPSRTGEPRWPSGPPAQDPVSPTRVWLDPNADWQGRLHERLLEKRIVLASGILDDEAAARFSAQLLTRMLDTLYFRLAEVTGREVDQIRDDSRRRRSLTTAQAIRYGLIQGQETSPGPAGPANPTA